MKKFLAVFAVVLSLVSAVKVGAQAPSTNPPPAVTITNSVTLTNWTTITLTNTVNITNVFTMLATNMVNLTNVVTLTRTNVVTVTNTTPVVVYITNSPASIVINNSNVQGHPAPAVGQPRRAPGYATQYNSWDPRNPRNTNPPAPPY